MTCGIYKIYFNDELAVYIGQSTCIEKRILKHLYTMSKGTASKKMQAAYLAYGLPNYEVLCECPESDLDSLEEEAIGIFNSFHTGLNSREGATTGRGLYGDKHPNSIFSNEQVVNVFKLLLDSEKSNKDIAEITKTNTELVIEISAGKRHTWLREMFIDEYPLVLGMNRSAGKNSAERLGISYPTIYNKEGTGFNVKNVSAFAKEHSLHCGHLNEVLNGKNKSTKGWHL